MSSGTSEAEELDDIQILNRALFFEHRGVWAYDLVAKKLTGTEMGKVLLELGLQNRADHERHRALLIDAVLIVGGTPVQMEEEYDLSSLVRRGDGDLDSDVNIAKLALALEVGAAVGYVSDTMRLKSREMIELEASIACVEAVHAARIRVAFNTLGIAVPVVPSAVMRTSSRNRWTIEI